MERPNDIDTAYTYDDANHLSSITHVDGIELLSSFDYLYDNVGNRIQAIEDVRLPELPSLPTNTPTVSPTETITSTFMPENTSTPTLTPSETWTPLATFTPSITPTSTPPGGPITIDYVYDPPYRLTEANYSNGDFYHYTYDAVGNRLGEESEVNGLPSTIPYTYDNANRLASVDSVSYTYDDNGNLLNDGTNTYTYDPANRLTSVNSTTTYAYNGFGDRYQQTVDSQTTTYILELNSGLTQVLDDGNRSYLYGLGRIAQNKTATEYFLGDVLGSVRQLVDDEEIVLAKGYTPYGVGLYEIGNSKTIFTYTGEQTDPNGLVYLRARYYNPVDGRFMSKDIWDGNVNEPISFNRWIYVNGDPINLSDPSGFCSGKPNDLNNPDAACWKEIELIENVYPNIDIVPKNWTTSELKAVKKSLTYITDTLGGIDNFQFAFPNTIQIKRAGWFISWLSGKQAESALGLSTITVFDDAFVNNDIASFAVIHEFGYFFDFSFGRPSIGDFKNNFWENCTIDEWGECMESNPVCKSPMVSPYGSNSPREDFAETFAAYIWSMQNGNFSNLDNVILMQSDERYKYMEWFIEEVKKMPH